MFTRDSNQSSPRRSDGAGPRDFEHSNRREARRASYKSVRSRAEYLELTKAWARSDSIDPFLRDAMTRPPLCTGSLRRIDGQVLHRADNGLGYRLHARPVSRDHSSTKLAQVVHFFASMDQQDPFDPDISRGWTRLLEGVSGDPTQWQMTTALRYWMAELDSGGIYLNYDLDNPRVSDCKLVEVDAGYLRVIPINSGADPIVKIRTCKQVRIRGVSSTATAALACGFGWGDAMSDMFEDGVTNPPAGRLPLIPSEDPGPPDPGESISQQSCFQGAGNLADLTQPSWPQSKKWS